MKKVIVEISARHIHISREHLDELFGKGYELTVRKELSQPGQYAAFERVSISGPKDAIANVSILGPVRPKTQVEVTFADARTLGIDPPIRESGDLLKSESLKLIGPKGEIKLSEGVIIAKRHLHITPEDANELGIKDGQHVSFKIEGERALIFSEIVVRVSDKYSTRIHIDVEEGNAAGIKGETWGEIIPY